MSIFIGEVRNIKERVWTIIIYKQYAYCLFPGIATTHFIVHLGISHCLVFQQPLGSPERQLLHLSFSHTQYAWVFFLVPILLSALAIVNTSWESSLHKGFALCFSATSVTNNHVYHWQHRLQDISANKWCKVVAQKFVINNN